jgi:sugar lactone lactonase YvrE
VTFRTCIDDLVFPECPRWHDGLLWFSDTREGRVVAYDPATDTAATAAQHDAAIAGLGFLPDETLLVVSSYDRRLLRSEPSRLVGYADLSGLVQFPVNDLIVDSRGRAYVGGFGFDLFAGETMAPSALLLVERGGAPVRVVAEDLHFPNGMAISADGRTLIVAETFAARLTAFTIAEDGSLCDRRLFADLAGVAPDGICLDEEGAVWVASPRTGLVRLHEGGVVTDRIGMDDRPPYACVLGGPDRRTLFVCTGNSAPVAGPAGTERPGRIEAMVVPVAGAGLP